MTRQGECHGAAAEWLVARARAAVPTLAAHADQTERDRRVAHPEASRRQPTPEPSR
jgi:hypothetical protein